MIDTTAWIRLIAGASVIVACGDVPVTPPQISDGALWSLESTVSSAVMATTAPYDTITLIPVIRIASGMQASRQGLVTFTSSDSTLAVNGDGVVTALESTESSYIVIRVYDSVSFRTLVDTVFIRVTEDLPVSPLHSFDIDVAPGDSAKLSVRGSPSGWDERYATPLVTVARNASGDDITSHLLIEYTSRNPYAATVTRREGMITAVDPGDTVIIVAATTWYGVTKTDSIRFITGYPLSTHVRFADETFFPARIIIGIGGTVIFGMPFNASYSVTFDQPAAAQASPSYVTAHGHIATENGNIPQMSQLLKEDLLPCFLQLKVCAVARTFSQAGTYSYHDAMSGAAGVIVVTTP